MDSREEVHQLAQARARYLHGLHQSMGGSLTWGDIANCYKWARDCEAWLPNWLRDTLAAERRAGRESCAEGSEAI